MDLYKDHILVNLLLVLVRVLEIYFIAGRRYNLCYEFFGIKGFLRSSVRDSGRGPNGSERKPVP